MPRRSREPAAPYAEAPAYPGNPAAPTGAYGDEVAPGLLRPRNGAGRAALVCGVLALICAIGFFLVLTIPVSIVLGLAAIVLGILGRGRVRRGLATNRGSATLGIVTGLLSLLLLAGLAAAGVALFSNNSDAKSYTDCVKQAGSNQQKQQDCATQFKDQITK
jgi:lysylphosphatidylglycerol synthetase-like protein (DUF2156 family)